MFATDEKEMLLCHILSVRLTIVLEKEITPLKRNTGERTRTFVVRFNDGTIFEIQAKGSVLRETGRSFVTGGNTEKLLILEGSGTVLR